MAASISTKAPFAPTNEPFLIIPEATVLRGEVLGMSLACVVVGPDSGDPLILEAGIGLSVHYLRPFIRNLAKLNYRVYFCNRPGQGSGDFYSGKGASTEWQGFDGALRVFTELRRYAYEASGGKPVVTVGHSLGGVVVRAAATGLTISPSRKSLLNAKTIERARRETKLVVPLFSLAIGNYGGENASRVFDLLAIKEALPMLADLVGFMSSKLPMPFDLAADFITALYFYVAQNSVHKDLFGTDDINFAELRTLGRFILPQKVSTEMVTEDAFRWSREGRYTTSSGLDFGQLWFEQQKLESAIPTLAIGGTRDRFTDVEEFLTEMSLLRNTVSYAVESGHIGEFLSHQGPEKMATLIRYEGDLLVGNSDYSSSFKSYLSKMPRMNSCKESLVESP